MSDVIPPAVVRLLPAREVAIDSYRFVFAHSTDLARALALPFLIEIILRFGAFVTPNSGIWAYPILWECLYVIPATIFGVAWHRLALLGQLAGKPSVVAALQRRHLRFYLFALAIALLYFFVTMMFHSLETAYVGSSEPETPQSDVLFYVAIVIFGLLLPYVAGRLSFVFPAISVDEEYGFRDTWRHTRRQGLRLWALLLAMFLPTAFVFGVIIPALDRAFHMDRPSAEIPESIVANMAYEILGFLIGFVSEYLKMALVVTAISLAFKTCTGWVPAEDENAED